MTAAPDEVDDLFWDDLLAYMDERRVIPVVDAGSLLVGDGDQRRPLETVLAQRLAERLWVNIAGLGPPLHIDDVVRRQRAQPGRMENIHLRIQQLLKELDIAPPPAQLDLAAIDAFDLIVSVSFDDLLTRALDRVRHGGQARTEVIAFAPNPQCRPGRLSGGVSAQRAGGRHATEDFLAELRRRWALAHPLAHPPADPASDSPVAVVLAGAGRGPGDGAVFISYSRHDAPAVERLAGALKAAGVDVRFDRDELKPGDAWAQAILKGIQNCALFIPVLASAANALRGQPRGLRRHQQRYTVAQGKARHRRPRATTAEQVTH